MTQTAAVLAKTGAIQVELPPADVELMPGVQWGDVAAFPTPAYFAFQAIARRLNGHPIQFRLGKSLMEEVGACLLGGHGIPSAVGLAAYEHLRRHDVFSASECGRTESDIERLLREPLSVGNKLVKYRFAAQKARYLAAALPLVRRAPSFATGRELRDWLMQLPGIGPKTASWVARNWLGANDVAILDIHILRMGQLAKLFPSKLTVERNYMELEGLFLRFCDSIGIPPSELDAVIWHEMAHSPTSVKAVIEYLSSRREKPTPTSIRRGREAALA